jgi:hypothetical protein
VTQGLTSSQGLLDPNIVANDVSTLDILILPRRTQPVAGIDCAVYPHFSRAHDSPDVRYLGNMRASVSITSVEIPFYQRVSLSHMNDSLSGYMFIRKDVVFQIVPALCDLCIGIGLSVWILHAGVHEVPHDVYDPWRALGEQGH